MKDYINNHLNNFIAGWYIDADLCQTIINKSEKNLSAYKSGVKEYTACDLLQFDKIIHDQYCEQLWNVIEEYKRLYPYCYEKLYIWGWTPPRIQRYDPGKAYDVPHCENNGEGPYIRRHMVYMTYLNDINDGGGTEFIHQNLVTPANQGLTLIWPATWTHYHKGVVAPKDVKYIVTGWLCFYPDNKNFEQ